MKEGWEVKKLTDLCSIQYGCAFESSLFSTSPEDGMPLIRIRDVNEVHILVNISSEKEII